MSRSHRAYPRSSTIPYYILEQRVQTALIANGLRRCYAWESQGQLTVRVFNTDLAKALDMMRALFPPLINGSLYVATATVQYVGLSAPQHGETVMQITMPIISPENKARRAAFIVRRGQAIRDKERAALAKDEDTQVIVLPAEVPGPEAAAAPTTSSVPTVPEVPHAS